jgi:hypothetical protein
MRVDSGPYRFIISPAKSIFYFDLALVSLVITLLSLIPIITSIKVIAIALVAWYGQVKVLSFKVAKSDELQYYADSRQWILNGARVYMQKQKFLTRNLVVINFYTETGKSLSQVITSDSMSIDQHIHLRKLIIAWSKNANRDE